MPDADPGSLDRLHDIALPPPVSWWPPAPGWYIVGAAVLVLAGVAVWVLVARWWKNRYRRAALRELDDIAAAPNSPIGLDRVADLVKRVALAAYPREQVASLNGEPWLEFLDASGQTDGFTCGPGRVLGGTLYSLDLLFKHDVPDPLVTTVRHWIRHHRC